MTPFKAFRDPFQQFIQLLLVTALLLISYYVNQVFYKDKHFTFNIVIYLTNVKHKCYKFKYVLKLYLLLMEVVKENQLK